MSSAPPADERRRGRRREREDSCRRCGAPWIDGRCLGADQNCPNASRNRKRDSAPYAWRVQRDLRQAADAGLAFGVLMGLQAAGSLPGGQPAGSAAGVQAADAGQAAGTAANGQAAGSSTTEQAAGPAAEPESEPPHEPQPAEEADGTSWSQHPFSAEGTQGEPEPDSQPPP